MAKARFKSEKQLEEAKKKAKGILSYRRLKDGSVVVAKVGVKRRKGYLYYIDKKGDISRAKMARKIQKIGRPKKVAKTGIKMAKGYIYYIDKQGDISKAKTIRGQLKKKAKR